MNQFLRSASILLAVLLLTACTKAPTVTTAEHTTSNTVTTATKEPAGPLPPATEPPVTKPRPEPPITEEKPPVTEEAPPTTEAAPPATLPKPPDPVTYPTWEGHNDIQLLAALDHSLGEVMELSQHESSILLSYATFSPDEGAQISAHAQLMDIVTGELSDPIPLPSVDSIATFLGNGNICVYDSMAGIAEVYTVDSDKVYSFVSGDPNATFYLDPTGDGTVWSYAWGSDLLTKIPLGAGSIEKITLPSCEGGYILGQRNGVLYYSAWDGEADSIYAISPDGEITVLDVANGYYWGDGVLYTDHSPNRIIDPDAPETVHIVKGDRSFFWIAACTGSELLVERFAPEEANAYSYYEVLDYRLGVYYPALATEPDRYYSHFYCPENGVLCFLAGRYNEEGILIDAELCRWNYLHDGEAVEVETVTADSMADENSAIAKRIQETWGIEVYYQPHLLHLVASDYSAAAVTDPQLLYDHLLQLEQALSAYPKGFFDDLCYGSYTHLEIYLCGQFTPLTPNGITTAEALSNTRGSAMVIGVNVHYLDGQYTRVLAHELLHIMERRIDQIDVDILGEWIALTPGGHDAYYYSYHDENGNEMSDYTHTYFYENDPTNAYFVDAYSKSYPTEDRARIFEKLMESGGDPYFSDSPVLMAKARTLCRIIRENFPSVAALARASWEIR